MRPGDVTPNFKAEKPEPDEKSVAQKRGARNRRSGMRAQREARKQVEGLTGTQAAKFAGQLGNEEAWHGLPWRIEVKSGAITAPAVSAYKKAKAQSDQNHAQGDPRPFVQIVRLQNHKPLAIIALEDLPAVLACVVATA